jgi:hypothetical protein
MTPQKKKKSISKNRKIQIPIFTHPMWIRRGQQIGQFIQDKKVRCYWEHVAKTLRTWGICWEPIGNLMGTDGEHKVESTPKGSLVHFCIAHERKESLLINSQT